MPLECIDSEVKRSKVKVIKCKLCVYSQWQAWRGSSCWFSCLGFQVNLLFPDLLLVGPCSFKTALWGNCSRFLNRPDALHLAQPTALKHCIYSTQQFVSIIPNATLPKLYGSDLAGVGKENFNRIVKKWNCQKLVISTTAHKHAQGVFNFQACIITDNISNRLRQKCYMVSYRKQGTVAQWVKHWTCDPEPMG